MMDTVDFHLRFPEPDFKDLPWHRHLSDWEGICDRLEEAPSGVHRHPVLFVSYSGILYALKELPGETAKVLKDGWLRTGDVGNMNARGYVTITDRKKDMILVSGFNVYPNEIEGVVAMHPGVLECAAIGVPDEHSGEAGLRTVEVGESRRRTAPGLLARHPDKKHAVNLSPKAEDTLLQTLKSDSQKARRNAVVVLGCFRVAAAVPSLTGLLTDRDLREDALEAIVRIGGESALGELTTYCRDSDPLVRRAAVEAIAALGTERGMKAILPLLSDPAEDVRMEAALALARFKSNEEARRALERVGITSGRLHEIAEWVVGRKN